MLIAVPKKRTTLSFPGVEVVVVPGLPLEVLNEDNASASYTLRAQRTTFTLSKEEVLDKFDLKEAGVFSRF